MIGAEYLGNNKCLFSVWAPQRNKMLLHLLNPERKLEMLKNESGYFILEVPEVRPGSRYFFMPDGEKDYPDPASNEQPDGVHGASSVVDHSNYTWEDQHWRNFSFDELILYELHVGTFTARETFEAIIPRLDDLRETGINAIELMPVAQFPGTRNWGYDVAYPYAVQHSYGGPDGLKKLVNACHQKGIAVFLDVVYNHLGPEGSYLSVFGPYFTDRYHTPWGDALNFDSEWSDGVREFYLENALFWLEQYHIDGLRFDAIHTIFDQGAVHFLDLANERIRKLAERVGRSLYTIAESDLNSPRVIKHPEAGGLGFTAQWLDDFHHSLYTLLDEKGKHRYADFGRTEQLAKAYMAGFVHSGEYVNFRKRLYGASSAGIPGNRFVVFNDNHDQSGNRISGERMSSLIDFERQKLAAAALLLSPYIPMLFMGEEYGEESPFLYFIDHSDPELVKKVREGRKKEFEGFNGQGVLKDPFDEKTFTKSRLKWETRKEGVHGLLLNWYRRLIRLRQSLAVLKNFNKSDIDVDVTGDKSFILHRQDITGKEHVIAFFNLSEKSIACSVPPELDEWKKLLDSKEQQWLENEKTGIVAPAVLTDSISVEPLSVVVYEARRTNRGC